MSSFGLIRVLKNLIKEGGLYMAFVVTGCLLLLSFWISENVQQNLLNQYRYDTLSLVIASEPSEELKTLLNSQEVIRYDLKGSFENKEQLEAQYPELKAVLSELESNYFPYSVLVTVKSADRFGNLLQTMPDQFSKLIVHEAPKHLATFFSLLLGLFAFLWLLLLALLIHFKLERLAVRETARWSLMKMLGAKPTQIFMPACLVQLGQIAAGSLVVLALSQMGMGYLRTLFGWHWQNPSLGVFAGFFFLSLLFGLSFFLLIFLGRYRRTALG
jgi:hypothetical protein